MDVANDSNLHFNSKLTLNVDKIQETCQEDFIVGISLGQGKFGQVFKVQDEAQNNYAMKTIKCSRQSFSDNGRREANKIKSLEHINIIPRLGITFINLLEKKGPATHLCILTDFYPGGNLYMRLNQPSSEKQKLSWIVQMAAGMTYMHSYHIVHGNLNLENILLTKDDRIKISDFGLAREFVSWADSTENDYSKKKDNGTISILAPEMFEFPKRYTKEGDVFALGTVYYSVFGRREKIAARDEIYGLGQKMYRMKKNVKLPFSVSASNPVSVVQGLIRQMLSFQHSNRPTAKEIFIKIKGIHPIESQQDLSKVEKWDPDVVKILLVIGLALIIICIVTIRS